LNARRADHSAVQVILHQIRDEGTKYVISVSKSVEIAQSGYAFADRGQDLCIALEEGKTHSNEYIYSTIAEMQKLAQDASAAATTTANMFRANRQEFTKVW
jgi:hypothetical protein